LQLPFPVPYKHSIPDYNVLGKLIIVGYHNSFEDISRPILTSHSWVNEYSSDLNQAHLSTLGYFMDKEGGNTHFSKSYQTGRKELNLGLQMNLMPINIRIRTNQETQN
jgi:hypothetical protein